MSYVMTAAARTNLGRRAKDDLQHMRVPGVVYGRGVDSVNLSVGRSDLLKLVKQAGFSSLVDLAMDNAAPVKVLLKEIQVDPVTNEPIHVDFHQVRMDEELETDVPLKFVGESPAVKSDGGTLVKSLDAINIRCLPANLPHEIEVDISKLVTFDDAISVADLPLPSGVTVLDDATLTVATVAAPLTEEELKKLEEGEQVDLSAIKTEGEEKKEAEAAEKAEEAAVEEATK